MEDKESKHIAVKINEHERKQALEVCASLGFTVENTEGTSEIQPKALGMKGVHVDFDKIEKTEKYGDIQLKQPTTKASSKRVDLSEIASDQHAQYIGRTEGENAGTNDDFMQLDVGCDYEHQVLNFNHRTRRKLRRAIDNAEIQREILVRERAIEHLKSKGLDIPPQLYTRPKPLNVKGHRIMEDGGLETDKQERVRARVELTEFNNHMRVLRRQAKEAAIYAGLKKHAELTGKIAVVEGQPEAAKAFISSDAVKADGIVRGEQEARIESHSDDPASSSHEEDKSSASTSEREDSDTSMTSG